MQLVFHDKKSIMDVFSLNLIYIFFIFIYFILNLTKKNCCVHTKYVSIASKTLILSHQSTNFLILIDWEEFNAAIFQACNGGDY